MNTKKKITEIYIYPVKGCHEVSVQSAMLDEYGFENDRKWMLINNEGRYEEMNSIYALKFTL